MNDMQNFYSIISLSEPHPLWLLDIWILSDEILRQMRIKASLSTCQKVFVLPSGENKNNDSTF